MPRTLEHSAQLLWRATRSCKHGGQYGECRQLDCFWIQRGDGSPEELQGFVKTWHPKYSTVQWNKHVQNAISYVFPHLHSLLPYFLPACGPPEKLQSRSKSLQRRLNARRRRRLLAASVLPGGLSHRWLAAKHQVPPGFGAMLICSAHDCETGLLLIFLTGNSVCDMLVTHEIYSTVYLQLSHCMGIL